MTYRETLGWMFAQLPMYQQKGAKAYSAKLESIQKLCEHLGNPERGFKSIHIAGTNGKGSSSHMLASILQEAGYRVGLYTSPHLKDFRERIRIGGKVVPRRFVIDFIAEHKAFFESGRYSFFEMTVGMAFAYFAQKKVDIAVVEVGLGGRLDSTNILRPEVCLITNIGMDHTDFLGDTLEAIAREKAGIIKENTPVVISETQPEIAGLFKAIAKEKKAPISFADQQHFDIPPIGLLGKYQQKNAKGVMAVLRQLKAFKVTETDWAAGLQNVSENTGLLGRWQLLGHQPRIICDTAHNSEGFLEVLQQLGSLEFKALHMVVGFVKDKKFEAILELLPKEATYYFCSPTIQRGLPVKELQAKAQDFGLKGSRFPSVSKALEAAKKAANPEDVIYVGGSTFVVAEAL